MFLHLKAYFLKDKARLDGELKEKRLKKFKWDGSRKKVIMNNITLIFLFGLIIIAFISGGYVMQRFKLFNLNPELSANKVLSAIADSVILIDLKGKILSANKVTCEMLGYSEDELLGRNVDMLFDEEKLLKESVLDSLFSEGSLKNFEMTYLKKNQDGIPIIISLSAIKDKSNKITAIVGTAKDIKERKDAERLIQYMAFHDLLTNLPNRRLMLDRVEQSMASAERNNQNFALLFFDLDRFKEINEKLGQGAGDILLKKVASRIKGCIRKVDTVARISADEFIILLINVPDAHSISLISEKIINKISEPLKLENVETTVTPSIGISYYPHDGNDRDELIIKADKAMRNVKKRGGKGYEFYNKSLNNKVA